MHTNDISSLAHRKKLSVHLWTRHIELPDTLFPILKSLRDPQSPDITILKKSPRRSVLRWGNFDESGRTLIIKGFPLLKLESRLKYKKYGLAEFNHYQTVSQHRIPTPECFGYFEARAYGTVRGNGVIIEDLHGYFTLAELAQREPEQAMTVLRRSIPLLKRLYESGVNHIDPSPQNMMESPDRTRLCLIDWQYCSFVAPQNSGQAIMQAAHFLRFAACRRRRTHGTIGWQSSTAAVESTCPSQPSGRTSEPCRPGTSRRARTAHLIPRSSLISSPRQPRPHRDAQPHPSCPASLSAMEVEKGPQTRAHIAIAPGQFATLLFDGLNASGIGYTVLRWFDEVPLHQAAEQSYHDDIDFLVDLSRLDDIIRLAARHPGNIKCDFYTPSGKRGTGYKGLPYYPPVLAEEILRNRALFSDSFYVPSEDLHFKSLAYHLVYHKGTESGLASGEPAVKAKRAYGAFIEKLGSVLHVPLEKPYSLFSLHQHLCSVDWSMPYDLMVRWPKQREWMKSLAAHEERGFSDYARKLPDIIVFLIRADACGDEAMEAMTIKLIEEKFHVLKVARLDPEMTRRTLRSVRGGNWVEHREATLVEPRIAVVCHDDNPKAIPQDDPIRKKYPLVQNLNVLYKNDIREKINELFPRRQNRIVIHGSDNAMEAQHHLMAVFGEAYDEVCRELESSLAARSGVNCG